MTSVFARGGPVTIRSSHSRSATTPRSGSVGLVVSSKVEIRGGGISLSTLGRECTLRSSSISVTVSSQHEDFPSAVSIQLLFGFETGRWYYGNVPWVPTRLP